MKLAWTFVLLHFFISGFPLNDARSVVSVPQTGVHVLSNSSCSDINVTPLSQSCDFNRGYCSFSHPTDYHDLRWKISSTLYYAGVRSLHGGSYIYPYTLGKHDGASSSINTTTINGGAVCIQFWYAMTTSTSNLEVLLDTNGQDTSLWKQTGRYGDTWRKVTLAVLSPSPFKIRFKFVRIRYDAKLCLDDIKFWKFPYTSASFSTTSEIMTTPTTSTSATTTHASIPSTATTYPRGTTTFTLTTTPTTQTSQVKTSSSTPTTQTSQVKTSTIIHTPTNRWEMLAKTLVPKLTIKPQTTSSLTMSPWRTTEKLPTTNSTYLWTSSFIPPTNTLTRPVTKQMAVPSRTKTKIPTSARTNQRTISSLTRASTTPTTHAPKTSKYPWKISNTTNTPIPVHTWRWTTSALSGSTLMTMPLTTQMKLQTKLSTTRVYPWQTTPPPWRASTAEQTTTPPWRGSTTKQMTTPQWRTSTTEQTTTPPWRASTTEQTTTPQWRLSTAKPTTTPQWRASTTEQTTTPQWRLSTAKPTTLPWRAPTTEQTTAPPWRASTTEQTTTPPWRASTMLQTTTPPWRASTTKQTTTPPWRASTTEQTTTPRPKIWTNQQSTQTTPSKASTPTPMSTHKTSTLMPPTTSAATYGPTLQPPHSGLATTNQQNGVSAAKVHNTNIIFFYLSSSWS